MRWTASLFCCLLWLFLLCFATVSSSTGKHSKCRYEKRTEIHQKTRSTKKFCDPASNSQAESIITQKCSSGFYREQVGPHRGQCVPCSCNGLSDECDEHTGKCLNCQFNTAGDHCERCKEGYYGNAADQTCHACPCPSTRNNLALACLDVGSGVVECLCKQGYSGSRCERCAFGYYGNPAVDGGRCRPCNCGSGTLNICNALTGECIKSDNSSLGDHCHECDSCTTALLVDLEKMDDNLLWLKQQLQNIPKVPGSLSWLNPLKAKISETMILVGNYSSAVRHVDSKVEHLEGDVNVVRDDLSHLIDKALESGSDLEKVSHNVNGTILNAEDLLSSADTVLTAVRDFIKQLTAVKPGEAVKLSEGKKARMMRKALRMVQGLRKGCCTSQRYIAGREEEEARTCHHEVTAVGFGNYQASLLDMIRNTTLETNSTVSNQAADSLMAFDSSLRELAELLSIAGDTVDRTQGLNLKSVTLLQHLQLDRGNSTIVSITEMTKDLLKNITDIFLKLEDLKKKSEHHGAQLDGARLQLIKKLNINYLRRENIDVVTEAEEHAEHLTRAAADLHQVLRNVTDNTDLLSNPGIGADDNIMRAIEKAEMAANQSREAADQTLRDMEEGGLLIRAAGLEDESSRLWTDAEQTQSDLQFLSHSANIHKELVKKQKEKRESLAMELPAVHSDIREIKRDDIQVLIESAKTAASDSKSTVSNVTERLKKISQEVDTVPLTNENDHVLTGAAQALTDLNRALPALEGKITQVEALSRRAPPSANTTDSIRRIKAIIEETRSYVNMLPVATTFNGNGHVELHPPKNLEDIKAFTAFHLYINRHENKSSEADVRRKRRQNRRREASFFVLYLGSKDASGDYIGMAIRNRLLICVYKLGGVVHELETSQITTTSVNSADFDRVIFHRVYQDAEVNITRNVASDKPVSLPPKRILPPTMTSILNLDPDNVVFYVGGYPDNFTPPRELNYPKYRGSMKLAYFNNNPACLFNFKHAVNMDGKQLTWKISRSEVSDYYEGTGYFMAFLKEPDRIKRRIFKFRINSRETNALLFYIGNEESFFCVFLERGFLVLQGWQGGREIRRQSAEKVSLFDKRFGIVIADTVIVHYEENQISAVHNQTNYMTYYIGGLPALLRQRHNITAPPLRGCVHHLAADTEFVQHSETIGVTDGCPVSLPDVRSATLYSPLSADSLSVGAEQSLKVSLGFRSTDRHGTLLRSSSQLSASVYDFQLSLVDGYVVFIMGNYTLRSDKWCSDGSWHYLSAERRPTGLELRIDDVKVTQGHSPLSRSLEQKLQGGRFTGCITNLYIQRPEQQFSPADLSLFSAEGEAAFGLCRLRPTHSQALQRRPQKQTPTQAPAGSHCGRRRAQHSEYQLSEQHSWLSYTLPQEDLNHRPHLSLDIKTNTSKGLILHVAGRGAITLLALYMANGKIKVTLGHNRIIQHNQRSNDGAWHRVEFSVERSSFHLLVDGFRVTDGHLPNNEGSALDLHNRVYLGADLRGRNTKGHNVPMNSIIGCIQNFKMNEEVIWEPDATHKILPCYHRLTETGTYFGGGFIILEKYPTIGPQFVLTFDLRPQRLTGLLFHVQCHTTSLSVYLKETEVGFEVHDGHGAVGVSVTPEESFCDGQFHSVTVSKQPEGIQLVVDSKSEQKAVPPTSTLDPTLGTLYIGGTTHGNQVAVSSPFVGCLRNVKLNGRPVAFETGPSRTVGAVSFTGCPAD